MLNIMKSKTEMADSDAEFICTKLKSPSMLSSKACYRKKPYERNKSTQSFGSFSLMLNEIAQSLTEEDTSLMKLIIQSDSILSKQSLDDIKYPADLLRLLHSKNLIQKENTDILSSILCEIKRHDLFKKLKQYTDMEKSKETEAYTETHCATLFEASGNLDLSSDLAEPTPERSSSLDSHMSIDDDDDEDVHSSQDSVSDEEKLSRLSIKA